MARTIAEYESLIEKLESSSQSNPQWYLTKVVLLAALGFGYIALALLLSLGLVLTVLGLVIAAPSFVTIKLGLIVGIPMVLVVWGTFKALRVRYDPPVGEEIDAADYPELFERIEQMRRELDGPKVHKVLITPELNAAIVGVPRLGMLGWFQNYLILGLPLMAALGTEEFDAVVGHEMGHLSGDHGRISGWIYRVRATWAQLAANIEGDGGFLFRRFFGWYIPYFNAYSFVLARQHEYEADEAGAAVTSKQAMGRALSRIEIVAQHLDEAFWPSLIDQNRETAEPPADLYGQMRDTVVGQLEVQTATQYLTSALERRPGLVDTHPNLQQRLDALGVDSEIPEPPEEAAGPHYFGSHFDALLHESSESWKQEIGELWKIRHEDLVAGAERLTELEEMREEGEDFDDELMWEYAGLIEQQNGSDAVLPVLREMREETSDDAFLASIEFHIGRILIEDLDTDGLDYLERAMELDEHMTAQAGELIAGYHFDHGVRADAQPYLDRIDVYRQKLQAAWLERNQLIPTDTYIVPDLDDEVIAEVTEALQEVVGNHRVFLVEKVMEYFPEEPCYIIGLSRGVGPLRWSADNVHELASTVELPIAVLWFDMGSEDSIARRIRKVKAARLF